MHSTAVRARTEAPVIEVFASIQGEGAYVGEPQSFLRLRGCPLRCNWCDTPGSWALGDGELHARVDAVDFQRRESAWATPFQALCWVAQVESGPPRTLSITGGEPLMWPEFILGLRSLSGTRRLHLETGGAHPRSLSRVIGAVDHVSLDLKVPSDLDPPVPLDGGDFEASPASEREWAAARAACLELVHGRDACAKLIVSGEHAARDFDPLVEDLARRAPKVPLYIQPVTPRGRSRAPSAELLNEVVERARELALVVRVIPQVHRSLGVQ
jgi:organic radical activating enzyme